MDENEAKQILKEQLEKLRKKSYADLCVYRDNIEVLKIKGRSGTEYQLEIQSFWDNQPKDNLRVLVSIDDGGWRAFRPLSNDFIIAPDGSFIGERK